MGSPSPIDQKGEKLKDSNKIMIQKSEVIAQQQKELIARQNQSPKLRDMDRSNPDTEMKLHRDNIPPPLKMNPIKDNYKHQSIRSAPLLRNKRILRKMYLPQRNSRYIPRPMIINSAMIRPTYFQIPPPQQQRINKIHFLNGDRNKIETPLVYDIYPSGEMKQAPLLAQPLSAQRLRFNHNEEDQSDDDDDDDDDDTLNVMSDSETQTKSFIINGDIKLKDEIFHYKFTSTNDQHRDKSKFLKICSSVWETFIN